MEESLDNRPLNHVDAAWLRMDSPANPMVITAALTFDGKVPFATLRRVIEERALVHERFRLRAVDSRVPLVPPRWERDPHFDVRSHLHHIRLPTPADAEAFADFVGDVMSSRLDPERPLWQSYVVDDVQGATALVARLHHCLADGVALVKMLLSMSDRASVLAPVQVGLGRAERDHRPLALLARTRALATTFTRLVLLPRDPPSPFRGRLGPRKCAARTEPLPLQSLKSAAKRLGGTLNDLVAASIAGALRSYFEAQGAPAASMRVRALVPVFLRDRGASPLGNHFSLVFLDLPLSSADRRDRFEQVKRAMDLLKLRDDALVAFLIMDVIGMASTSVEQAWLAFFSHKASLLSSTVPGPREPLKIAGHTLRDITVWAPVAGSLGVGITAISYAEQLRIGVQCNASLVPNPALLARMIDDEARAFLSS